MYFKGEKEFHWETDWDEPWPKQYMGQIFSNDKSKKSATSVDKCDDEKKMAHPWSETTETFVDNVF